MHARRILKQVMAILVGSVVSACSASGTLTGTQPKMQELPAAARTQPTTHMPLTGTWKGTWESDGRSHARGHMEMEFETLDGDRVAGRMRAADSASYHPTCSREWEQFTGTISGERVSVQYNLRGRCGNVTAIFLIDLKKNNLLSGTYTSEFPGSGKIRLTRQ